MLQERQIRASSSRAAAALSLCLSVIATPSAGAQGETARAQQGGAAAGAHQRNAGSGAELDLPDRPQVLWKYAPEGSSFDEVVAHDGIVIALERRGELHALDAATGDVRWKSSEGYKFSYGFGLTLTRDPDFDVVLVGCDSGLFAVERRTGKLVWKSPLPKGVAGPTCAGGAVFAGSGDGKVYACDLRSGKTLWQHDYLEDRPQDPEGFDGESARFAGLAARPMHASTDGTTVFLSVFDQCRTLAVDAKTGKRRWAFRSQGWMYSRPTIGERDVYVASQDRGFYAVDKTTGTQTWKVTTAARNEAAAALGRRLVVFGSCDGNVYAADRIMGSIVWKFALDEADGTRAIYARPLISHDRVYLAAMRGTVYALELRTGKRIWKLEPLPGSELNSDPEVDGGRMFLTTRRRNGGGESAVLALGDR